eukprot:TRINITY_DN5521_c0_g1_i1.p1 TRINITY_DN5521_c0_g1~~TRINITY_DN5521_c0_g1_i1.p1  ORF type:complete len:454 (+),score=106.09 TRINITY_DN5521_c0_g1_i1:23-1363(+)
MSPSSSILLLLVVMTFGLGSAQTCDSIDPVDPYPYPLRSDIRMLGYLTRSLDVNDPPLDLDGNAFTFTALQLNDPLTDPPTLTASFASPPADWDLVLETALNDGIKDSFGVAGLRSYGFELVITDKGAENCTLEFPSVSADVVPVIRIFFLDAFANGGNYRFTGDSWSPTATRDGPRRQFLMISSGDEDVKAAALKAWYCDRGFETVVSYEITDTETIYLIVEVWAAVQDECALGFSACAGLCLDGSIESGYICTESGYEFTVSYDVLDLYITTKNIMSLYSVYVDGILDVTQFANDDVVLTFGLKGTDENKSKFSDALDDPDTQKQIVEGAGLNSDTTVLKVSKERGTSTLQILVKSSPMTSSTNLPYYYPTNAEEGEVPPEDRVAPTPTPAPSSSPTPTPTPSPNPAPTPTTTTSNPAYTSSAATAKPIALISLAIALTLALVL